MTSKDEIHDYFIFELFTDPSEVEEAQVETDAVTWQTFIQNALKSLHGLFGLAVETEIVRTKGMSALVKVQKEDSKTLRASMTTYQPTLSMFGLENVQCRVGITEANGASQL